MRRSARAPAGWQAAGRRGQRSAPGCRTTGLPPTNTGGGLPCGRFCPRRVISPGNGAGPAAAAASGVPSSLPPSLEIVRTKNALIGPVSPHLPRPARTPRRLARSGTDNKRSPVSPLPGCLRQTRRPSGSRAPGTRPQNDPGPALLLPLPFSLPRQTLSLSGRDSTEAAPGVAGGGKRSPSVVVFSSGLFSCQKNDLFVFAQKKQRGHLLLGPVRCQRAFLKAASVSF